MDLLDETTPKEPSSHFIPLTIDDLRRGLNDEQLAALSKELNVVALVNGLFECAIHVHKTKCSTKLCTVTESQDVESKTNSNSPRKQAQSSSIRSSRFLQDTHLAT